MPDSHTGRAPLAPLGVLVAALLFSTGGAAIKACGLSGWQVASFRSGIAALFILSVLPSSRRGWNRGTLVVALAYASTLILFARANKLTTAAHSIFLQSTAPLFVLLLSPWLLRERIRRSDLGLMVALALGLVLLFAGQPPTTALAADPVKGNVLATASGLFWGLTILGLRWAGRGAGGQDSSAAAVALGNLVAFLVGLPAALPVSQARPGDWVVLAYLGIVQVGLAYVFLTRSLRHVPAFEASLLLLLEPVLNPLWAWAFQGERPGSFALVGGGLILGASLTRAVLDATGSRSLESQPETHP
jgi:DME family drug/metabolite transporter